jgi:hypothetical protein
VTDAIRFPGLAAWQRRWRSPPASHDRFGLPWQSAWSGRQAEVLDASDFTAVAERALLRVRQFAAEADAA